MRVLVCGGRDFTDEESLFRSLDQAHATKPITLIIHGGARGADVLGGKWALTRNIPVRVFHAQWDTHGRSAGHIRNQQMLDEGHPDFVLACPGGAGTANMIARSKAAGVPIANLS